jgi:protocatechuate 3,4-dioxygenase beta subunit
VSSELSRRDLLLGGLALAPLVLAACSSDDPVAAPVSTSSATSTATTGARSTPTTAAPVAATPAPPATTLAPTPACEDADATASTTEGPYYTPSTPERSSLIESGMAGTPIVVQGHVLTTACVPVAGAIVDVWQADDAGEYDNEGFRLRGFTRADGEGRYRMETIVPGLYPGRTRHIHVKVAAPEQPALTTQLFFPGEASNAGDGIFRDDLLLDTTEPGSGRFDFVLDV